MVEVPSLEFERPIVDLERKIDELKQLDGDEAKLASEIKRLEAKADSLRRHTFAKLTPWQVVQLSRHPARPYTLDYIAQLTTDFIELHGDRSYADDPAIVAGLAHLDGIPVAVLGHQKGRSTKENVRRNFGMPRPEGYRKAKRLMELAARFGLPIVSFIDTPGAYPGIGAEERGQAEAIAKNLEVLAGLPVPIVVVVIGEGGSGGALAIGVGDRLLMLQYSVYSVISPEGSASILWKDAAKTADAAGVLRLQATDLSQLKVVDELVEEPPGGAHRAPATAIDSVGAALRRHVHDLRALSAEQLIERRYDKYRRIGAFVERS